MTSNERPISLVRQLRTVALALVVVVSGTAALALSPPPEPIAVEAGPALVVTTTAPDAPSDRTPQTTVPTTTTTATTAPSPGVSGAGNGDPNDYASWDRLAQCESGGNWAINTGNGYYGGLQFHPTSWRGVGGTGLPHEHSRETQIAMGQRLYAQGGWGHWPGCTRSFGWR